MRGLLFILIFLAPLSLAAQYQSHELQPLNAEQIQAQTLSVDEVERNLAQMQDAYQKASTERFLARHYLQEKNYQKAADYYQQALQGDGLSVYAKQDMLAELASVYFLAKQYQKTLQTLAHRQTIGGKPDTHLSLMQALSFYFSGQKTAALNRAKTLWLEQKPQELNSLKQLVFIFYHGGDYAHALAVQKRYIEKMPDDMAAWRLLASIYIQQKNYQKASDSLALALQHQLALEPADIIQLAELYAYTHNPYAAARLLAQALADGRLAVKADYLDKQYRYWLLAREYQKAIQALEQLNQLAPSIEQYLQLARLNWQQKQWQAMRDNVLSACAMDLPDENVGEANLLLGISELNLQDFAKARMAFINATLIGGVIDEANAWLAYMQAQGIEDEEKSQITGACTPKWARVKSQQLAIATQASASPDTVAVSYQVKISPNQTLAIADYTLALDELKTKIKPLAIKLGMSVVKNKGQISGNMLFIFPEPSAPNAEVIHFQMAFPVGKLPDAAGQRFRLVEDKAFKSAAMIFDGAPSQLIDAWKALYQQVLKDGLTPTGVARQEILKPSKDHIKMELQLGVQ